MKISRKRLLFALFLSVFWILGGCATQTDLNAVQRESNNMTKEVLGLQRNLYDLNAEIKDFSGKLDKVDKRTADLQRDVGDVKAKMGSLTKEMESSSQPMRRNQADLGARMDKLQLDVQNLTGRFEESKYFAEKTFGATKNYQTRLEELEKRVADGQTGGREGGRGKAPHGHLPLGTLQRNPGQEIGASPEDRGRSGRNLQEGLRPVQ